MSAELEAVMRSSELAGSPVMQRLLRFLVEHTLLRTDKSLKAYTIAVEGLGRAADFDPLTDSYPRVQVGRLRKVLEAYYARHADDKRLCLYIRPGDYRVRLARRTTAYPQLSAAVEPGLMPEPLPVSMPLPLPIPEPVISVPKPLEMSVTLSRPLRFLAGMVGGAALTATFVGVILIANTTVNCPILPQIAANR